MIRQYKNQSRVIGIAGLLLLAGAFCAQFARAADPDPAIRETTAAPPVAMKFDGSKVRIMSDDPESAAARHQIKLERGKAAIVELPKDARDILVSDPKIADARVRTPRQIYVIGTAIGATNIIFFDEHGGQILNLELLVQLDAKGATEALQRHFPDSNLRVESLNNNLAISGRVPNVAASEKALAIVRRFVDAPENVVNLLAVEGDDQVLLKVRVSEMQRSVIKQLGINLFGTLNRGGGSASRFGTNNQFNVSGSLLGGLTAGANKTVPGPAGDPFGPLGGVSVATNSISGVLQALERNGLVRVLAEPNLTAVSGESAKFLAGGEFPVPAGVDTQGNIKIEFKPFGVGLGFTPVVLSDGRINLRLSTEVSQISNEQSVTLQTLVIPGLSVRRAETSVELPSGGSLVIAGLLQNDIQKSIDGIPGLKDIPILGSLFRSSDFQNNETELVIVVTPYLVNGVSEDQLRLPTDGFTPSSDFDSYFLGQLHGVYKRKPSPGTSLQGPYGHIME
ncbi:MAG: type II and III secretion system protein family protein [Pseudomonadota bacterium]